MAFRVTVECSRRIGGDLLPTRPVVYTATTLDDPHGLLPSESQQPLTQRTLNYLIEDVRLRSYLIAFLVVVVTCGWLYSHLTVHGHGVNTPGLGFLEGVFFSIVTVTSLGYGDIYPVGFSRVIAGVEVLFGLALMGIMIAKVTSRRLSYHVQRLFATDAQRRLDDFAERFDRIRTLLTRTTPALGSIYGQTPEPHPSGYKKTQVLDELRRAIERFNTASTSLLDYLALESKQHAYFKVVPRNSVRRVGKSLDDVLYVFGQLVISLPASAKPEAINSDSRHRTRQALRALERTAAIVQDHCPDQESVERFGSVQETYQKVKDSHFGTPGSPGLEPPGQSIDPEARDIPEDPVTTG